YPASVFNLLSFHRLGRRGAGSYAGSFSARVPLDQELPRGRGFVYGVAGEAQPQSADLSLPADQARPRDRFDRDSASGARREDSGDGADRWSGGGTRGQRFIAGGFAKALAGAARDRDPARSGRVGLSGNCAGVEHSRGNSEVEIKP